MKNSLNNSQIYGIIGVCVLVLGVLFYQTRPELSQTISVALEPVNQVAQAVPTATLTLSPSVTSVNKDGEFLVNIVLNTGGQGVYGVDINKLKFNSSVIQIVDASTTAPGAQITAGTGMTIVFANYGDNSAGTLQFSVVADPGTVHTTSPYTIGTIRFKAVGAGTSNITWDFAAGSGTDTNVAGVAGDILQSVGTATYTVTLADPTAPTAPGTPTLSRNGTSINLSWAASTDNIGVTAYRVERCSTNQNCTNFAYIATSTTSSYTDTNLVNGTTYRYRIAAADAAGNMSGFSGISTLTLDSVAPGITIGTPVIAANSLTINWTTTEQADTQVEYGKTTAYGSQSVLDSTMSTTHSVVLSGLEGGTTYNYRVKSRDAAGNLATSPNNALTTTLAADTTNPNVPANFRASAAVETEISLSWDQATDPAGVGQQVSGVAKYEIFKNNVVIAQVLGANVTAYIDKGLTAGSTHSYQVRSVDVAGNPSAKSPTVTATTPTLSQAVQRQVTIAPEGAPATKRDISGIIDFLNPTTQVSIYQAPFTTNSLGVATVNVISGLPQTVLLKAKITGYLATYMPNVDIRDSSLLQVTFPELPAGDFSGDNFINTVDVSYLNTSWGTADALTDLNKDGTVNSLDFTFMSKNFGRTTVYP
jgi:fibronectin type 3 domain-containing protein